MPAKDTINVRPFLTRRSASLALAGVDIRTKYGNRPLLSFLTALCSWVECISPSGAGCPSVFMTESVIFHNTP
jgi:hypothetical protein